MTVECPGCSTTFPVDPKKVPVGGVHARCSVCGEVFFVDVPAPVSAAAHTVAVREEEAPPMPEEAWEETPETEGEPEADAYPDEAAAEEPGETATLQEHEPLADTPSEAMAEESVAGAPLEEPSWAEPEAELGEEEPSWEGAPEPVEEEEPSWGGVTESAAALAPAWAESEEEVAEEEVPEPAFVPPTDEPLAETVEPLPAELPALVAEEEVGGDEQALIEDVPDLAAAAEASEDSSPWIQAGPTAWEGAELREQGEGTEEEAIDQVAEAEGEEAPAEAETPLQEPGDQEDVTEAFGEAAFAEELTVLEAADAEGTFRVDETPVEEELPFVGEVTPEGELAPESGPEEVQPEASETPFQVDEPTFGEGELIFTMDTPGVGEDVEQAPGFALGSASPDGELQDDVSEPEPQVDEPAAPLPPPPPLPTPQFGRRDPKEKAQRLARVLVSDIILYNPDRHQRALEQGRLKEEFEDEIQKSWNEYVEQVGSEIANGTDFFTDALNEILAKGRRTF